jgi:DNA mismatch repair protein MutL
MPIRILSEQVASQIAAGEVVERPASVVKELIENAIDAGATTVHIDVRGGGQQLIQVSDDGSGIGVDEIALAFTRHATSKLEKVDDLEAIATLGFRGEALAAIAAVSRLTAVSRADGEPGGTRLFLEGGHISSREGVGAPQGTVIAVANLFYNVPARRSFLKSVTTEKRLIDEIVSRYALAYPAIRFRLSHDNRITFQTTGSGSRLDVLAAIYGPEKARQLLAVDFSSPDGGDGDGIRVEGYVGPPSINWANRSHITVFVNGRWIKDNQLAYAVIQAYHTLLPSQRYPLAVLFLSLPADQVDVNVHPTKSEVRFRQGKVPFGVVQRAVRQTLVTDSPVSRHAHFDSFRPQGWAGALDWAGAPPQQDGSQGGLDLGWWSEGGDDGEGQMAAAEAALELGGERLPIMRVVGQVGAAYIITEGPDGLFLIDQHAAHERILYERFMAAWEVGGQSSMAAQALVSGVAVPLTPSQASLLTDQLDLLGQIGFEIEPFGPNTFMVRSIPAMLTNLDPARALEAVVEDLEREEPPLAGRIEERIILRVCKSAAVKAGQSLSRQEMEAMVQQLEQSQNPRTCPHGRPTLIHLSAAQLARQFGRI